MTDGPRRYLISGELRNQLIDSGRALIAQLQPFEGTGLSCAHQLVNALDALSTWAPGLPESLRLPGEPELHDVPPAEPMTEAQARSALEGEFRATVATMVGHQAALSRIIEAQGEEIRKMRAGAADVALDLLRQLSEKTHSEGAS
jgi:hypothetical protein